MLIRILTINGTYNIKITEDNLISFGITNERLWNKNNTFKKWWKRGYVYMDNKRHYFRYDIIKDIKVFCKVHCIKYNTEKTPCYEYKHGIERESIDWNYNIIKKP